MSRKSKSIISMIAAALVALCVNGYCVSEPAAGVSFEEISDGSKKIRYSIDGERGEIKPVDTAFIEPAFFAVSREKKYIIFVDSIEDNEFDGYMYIYDITAKTTNRLFMRNVRISYIKNINWFDSHSFIMQIKAGKRMNYVIENYGPFDNGTYIVRFDDDYKIGDLIKLNW